MSDPGGNPGGDPGPIPDPIPDPAEYMVEKPKLGDLLPVGPGKHVAVVGGQPTVDLQELVNPDPHSKIGPFRHRPTDTAAAQKGEQIRVKGLEPQITVDSKLSDVADKIGKHLVKHGIDTISYFASPADNTKTASCVLEYPLFPLGIMEQLCENRYAQYDGYSQRNDDEAIEYLLNSVDDSLKMYLDSTSKRKPFGHYFANLVDKLQQGTEDRIDAIKKKLLEMKASDYSGEDIDALWADVKKLVEELKICGAYDHRLTKEMAMMLEEAGGTGSGGEQFRHEIRTFVSEYNKAMTRAIFLSNKDKDAAMKAAKCMPEDLFGRASQAYRSAYNTQRWAPARNIAKIPGDVPPTVAAAANAVPTDLQAFANAVVQAMKQTSEGQGKSGDKPGVCYNCGESGHFQRDCPELKDDEGTNKWNGRRRPQQLQTNDNKGGRSNDAWKTKAPGPNDPGEKKVNGRKFHWCEKCNRWTTTHSTATHVVKGAAANFVPYSNFAWCAPVGVKDLFRDNEPASKSGADPSPSSTTHAGHEILRLLGWFSLGIGYTLGVFSAYIKFAWWSSAVVSGFRWLVEHRAEVVPLSLWFGLIVAGMTLPWTLLPLLSPTPSPTDNTSQYSTEQSKDPRYLRRLRKKGERRLKKHSRSRSRGATRLGFHRSFPLRWRVANLHSTMPSLRQRSNVRTLNYLAEIVQRFVSQPFPSAGCREGDSGHAGCANPAEGKGGESTRLDSKDSSEQTVNKAVNTPSKKRSQSKKAKRAPCHPFDETAPNCPVREPEPDSLKRPFEPSDTKIQLSDKQARSFDEIFGTPLYYTFVAQAGLPDDVKKLAECIRKGYMNRQNRPKVKGDTGVPVVWDSGASTCVSFDRNDFVGPIKPPDASRRLRGFSRNGPRISGIGTVAWSFKDVNGNLRTLMLPAMFVPEVKQRLLSTTCLLQTYPGETLTILSASMRLSGDGDKLGAIEVRTDPTTNLPTAYALGAAEDDGADAHPFASRSTIVQSATRRAKPSSPTPFAGPPSSVENRPMVAIKVETPWTAQEVQLDQQREVLPAQQREQQPTVESHQQREGSRTTPTSTLTDAPTLTRPAPTTARPALTVSEPTDLLIGFLSAAAPDPVPANTIPNLTPTPTVHAPPVASPRNFERETSATTNEPWRLPTPDLTLSEPFSRPNASQTPAFDAETAADVPDLEPAPRDEPETDERADANRTERVRDLETLAPIVAWATVRLFLVLPIVLGWKAASAFTIPVQLERFGFGIPTAPYLWRPNPNVLEALLDPTMGLTQSSIDPRIFFAPSLLIVKLDGQLGIAAPTNAHIDTVIMKLKVNGLELSRAGSFEKPLGIERKCLEGNVVITQKHLIRKIIAASGLESCTPRSTPAALRRDEYGATTDEPWWHSFVLDMLRRLAASTRPDIAFAVSTISQPVARISANPTTSDGSAIKRIVRYLAGTADQGTIITPRADLKLELFCSTDVDYGADHHHAGFVITLGGTPVVWSSKRHPVIAPSAFDADCASRQVALRTLSHLLLLLKEIAEAVGLSTEILSTIRAEAFEDNPGLRALTAYSPTSPYAALGPYPYFREVPPDAEFPDIEFSDRPSPDADYLTTVTPQEAYQENRRRIQGW
jgi:Zinc knuckle